MNELINDKIDMVYLWCDGNEPAFKARRYECLGMGYLSSSEEVSGDVRFFDNEELKYSLRSLEQYAPWINHVYIVTDRQVPTWLDTDYEMVSIIDHSQIMPQECIPCFNSATIEQFLPYIPNLSEKFLYGNDDTFFASAVTPNDFFKDDKPIVRVKKRSFIMRLKRTIYKFLGVYEKEGYTFQRTLLNAIDLLEREYGKSDIYSMYHNIDAYSKSAYFATLRRFAKEFKKCERFRFRHPETIQRVIFGLDAVYSGKGIIDITNVSFQDVIMGKKVELFGGYGREDNIPKLERYMQKYSHKVFCLQAATDANLECKMNSKAFLEGLFSNRSRFEKC